MKKSIVALTGIVMIAAATILYSCNKEGNEIANGNVGTEVAQAKANSGKPIEQPVTPHFLFRTSINPYAPCTSTYGYFCGCNIDVVLTGDETCWLMIHEKDPYGWLRFYIPNELLYKSNAGEVVDSAQNGAVTFHADCEIMDKELAEIIGTDLIPAGRYQASLTTYKGDRVVCVNFGTTL